MRGVLAAAFVLFIAGTVYAQDKPTAGLNFGGGWAFPVSGVNDAFNAGWNGSLGLTYNITPKVGVLAEYMYDRLGGPDRQITISQTPTPNADDPTAIIESNHQMHAGTFNLVYTPSLAMNERSTPMGLYVLGGAGIYHRLIQLTTLSAGYASVCNPYWYICYPTLVPVNRIIGDRSSNDFGIDVGAGLAFGTNAKFYIESRYHYVWGPKIRPDSPQNGVTEYSTNAGYFPLTFGVRW